MFVDKHVLANKICIVEMSLNSWNDLQGHWRPLAWFDSACM